MLIDKYKFTEKERDEESGYDYVLARYYDSKLGIWLSVDPMADKYPGWSPYKYIWLHSQKYFP
ncbi:MAG: RHS repeat-associated core domain-containing protein [Ignavibacteria bacterium]|jgi:RHS repeat-associated protein